MPQREPWPLPARIAAGALLVGAAATYMKVPDWATSGLAALAIAFFVWAGFMRSSSAERAPRLTLRLHFLGLAAFTAAGAALRAQAPDWALRSAFALAVFLFISALVVRITRRSAPDGARSP